MDKVTLVVQPRDTTGSRSARRLRGEGMIPGVLYGHGKDATLFAVDPHDLRLALTTPAGRHAVLDVTIEGHKRAHKAIIKDMQLHHVRPAITHLDLQEIRLDETIETTVAVHFEGEAEGVKSGGMLDESTREVNIRGLVTSIPEHLVIDISGLDINDTAKVGDLTIPEGIEILNDPEEVLCSILPPRKAEAGIEREEAVEAEGGASEPAIVGKGEAEGASD